MRSVLARGNSSGMFAKTRLLLGVCTGAAVLLVVASTALAENYRYRFTKADEALAAGIVRHGADVKGWTGGPVKPDLTPNPVRCTAYYAPKESDLIVTGDKESDYTRKSGQEIDTYATVFQSKTMAEADWRRSAKAASFFKCLRAKWTALPGAKGSKIVSVAQLSLPAVGTHSFAYRVVFELSASRERVAVDSVILERGRVEVEVDQIFPDPSADDLTNMKLGDKYLASALDRKVIALS